MVTNTNDDESLYAEIFTPEDASYPEANKVSDVFWYALSAVIAVIWVITVSLWWAAQVRH